MAVTTTTSKSKWPLVMPLLMAYSVSLGPIWEATAMTTTNRPARLSMPGYLVSRRHRLSRLSSASEPLGVNVMSGSA